MSYKKQGYNAYEIPSEVNTSFDMESLAADIIERSRKKELPCIDDQKQLKHMISDDLTTSLPPQIYKIIAEMIDLIGEIDV